MALFPLSGVLRGFSPATYEKYASASTLMRPCSEHKMLIYELETDACAPFLILIQGIIRFKEKGAVIKAVGAPGPRTPSD
jgi:hypothetical protein